MNGVFIALDGTDALVTEAQFSLLARRLREAGHDVETFNFPQLDRPSGHFVREYLSGRYGSAEEVGPYTGSLFYALDQYHEASRIREAVRAGKVVLAYRYTGTTMAEQGQKFVHPEERRGFFLWLESMETRMFGLPRPAASIILRTPVRSHASYSPSLLTESYDDLSSLFPKDYWRLDGMRGGKVLPGETLHSLILAKITPLLPPAANNPSDAPGALAAEEPIEIASPVKNDILQVSIEDVSSLLAAEICNSRSLIVVEQPKDAYGKFSYFVPEDLDDTTRSEYTLHVDRILDIHAKMSLQLTAHLEKDAASPEQARFQAQDILSAVLPAAVTSRLDIAGTEKDFKNLIAKLHSRGTQEAADTADKILQAARQNTPHALRGISEQEPVSSAAVSQNVQGIDSLASRYLADTHAAADSADVALVDIWPRNELDLVPDMLYEHGGLPLADIRKAVSSWAYEQKAEIMHAYLGVGADPALPPGNALEKARYSFDVQSDFRTLRDLQLFHVFDYMQWQPLTPRFGFDVPSVIEETGLTDDFEECFMISLKLHSLLQQAGFAAQAQYAVLQGHKTRMQLQFSARQAFLLLGSSIFERPSLRNITTQIRDKLAEYHPLLADAIKTYGPLTDAGNAISQAENDASGEAPGNTD